MMRYEVNNFIELRSVSKEIVSALETLGVETGVAFNTRLIVCELAGNVVKHAQCKAWIEIEVSPVELILTVYAENGSLPPEDSNCPECEKEGGRGLYLVDRLSARRTVTQDGGVRIEIEL